MNDPSLLASPAPHPLGPARDAADALERRGVVAGQGRVQKSARATERDPARGVVQRTFWRGHATLREYYNLLALGAGLTAK